MDFLKGLNPQQREAVACTEGPLLILAGAGQRQNARHHAPHRAPDHAPSTCPPSAILAVTFTNKAAAEMRERVASLLEGMRHRPRPQPRHVSLVLRAPAAARWRRRWPRSAPASPPLHHLRRRRSARHHQGRLQAPGPGREEFMQYRAALSVISQAKNSQEVPAGSL